MAYGDVKRKRQRTSGYRSAPVNWNAQDRQASYQQYLKCTQDGDVWGYFVGMSGDALMGVQSTMSAIKRRGAYDWQRVMESITPAQRSELEKRIADRQKEINAQIKDRSEKRKAARIAKVADQSAAYKQHADLTAGMLRSDVHQAIAYKEKYGLDDGDWLDDAVAAYSGKGWAGQEVAHAIGVKLQITLSLDVSNSMWHNGIASDAVKSFIELGLALKQLQAECVGSVYTQAFLFAKDENGKVAERLRDNGWGYDLPEELRIGEFEQMRDAGTSMVPHYAGDDTWISPLFFALQTWEMECSDPGAVRLDLVITDGVLEHPRDISAASKLQEQRDGALQTVLLNFLPESDWQDSLLPNRCVQYHVDSETVGGTLRNLIGEFVSVYV